ncbi:MAG: diguanylate cyclase [Deltaproteobacteria bacterium]|nr:diguanylate cyclase [Deltaproteobacteria bacterium]
MVAQGETLGILRILPPEEDWDPTMMNLSPVTISMGVSLYPDHGTEDSKLLSIADEALYQTKSSGRNRDVLANTETGIHAVENRAKPNP